MEHYDKSSLPPIASDIIHIDCLGGGGGMIATSELTVDWFRAARWNTFSQLALYVHNDTCVHAIIILSLKACERIRG